MVALQVVVLHVLRYCPSQMPLSQRHQLVQTFGAYGEHKAFRHGVRKSSQLHIERVISAFEVPLPLGESAAMPTDAGPSL